MAQQILNPLTISDMPKGIIIRREILVNLMLPLSL